ncbi:MAG: O-antigen ligase family protein [Candidatus Omnitrophota bacterium]
MTLAIIGAVAIVFGALFLGEQRTYIGILGYGYAALLYVAASLRIGSEKASRMLLYCTIASIPFPFLIQFQGKDAATVTTLLILSLAGLIVCGRIVNKEPVHKDIQGMYWYLPLCICVSFTAALVLNPYMIGQSVRYYLANISGILAYMAILALIRTRKQVVVIVNIILAALLIQSLFSLLQLKFPALADMLNIFGTRTGTLDAMFVDGIQRATGTMGDYELLAEWFLIGGILSFYMVYETRRYWYCLPLMASMAGILFTKTRSDILLFAVSFIIIFIILKAFNKDKRSIAVKVALIMICGMCLVAILFPGQAHEAVERIMLFMSSRNMFSPEAINRKEAWQSAQSMLREPAFFGNGLFNIESMYASATMFHSLFLTLLYKVGFAGLALHAAFWLFLFTQAMKFLRRTRNVRSWYAVFFFTVALAAMLIDGIKIEYLRYAHTIQFAWVMYGLLAVLEQQKVRTYENTLVPETAV